MAKDSLAAGARSASFGHSAKKDEPIEFHGTVAVEEPSITFEAVRAASKECENATNCIHYGLPLNDRVLIRRIEQKSDELIVQPDAYAQLTNVGTVLAVAQNVPLEPGNTVLFGQYNVEDLTIHGEKLCLVDFHDIRIVLPR